MSNAFSVRTLKKGTNFKPYIQLAVKGLLLLYTLSSNFYVKIQTTTRQAQSSDDKEMTECLNLGVNLHALWLCAILTTDVIAQQIYSARNKILSHLDMATI